MHRLSAGLILGFHGCDRKTADRLISGQQFVSSQNDYDWLGEGIYFWEANPLRGLQFVREKFKREKRQEKPYVVGAVIDPGLCLDLTTTAGVLQVQAAFKSLDTTFGLLGESMPQNSSLLRRLDCAVVNHLHELRRFQHDEAIDTVRGIFIEGKEAFPDAGFAEKTDIQIAVRNPHCIKGVFRVPRHVMAQH